MKESPKNALDIPGIEETTSRWERLKGERDKFDESIGKGFANIPYSYHSEESVPYERTIRETISGTVRQNLTNSFLNGLNVSADAPDPNYDVRLDMRPTDYRFPYLFAFSQNTGKTQEIQQYIDNYDNDMNARAARPGVSFFASLADPALVGLDLATYGLSRAVTLPLIATTSMGIRGTYYGSKLVAGASRYPRTAAALSEGVIGATSGAASMGAMSYGQVASDAMRKEEEIGEGVFFGALVGGALGGAVGAMGRNGTKKLTQDFIDGHNVTQAVAKAPDFVGPPKPRPEQIPGAGMRMSLKEEPKPKLTPEEIKTKAAEFEREHTIGSEPLRAAEYEMLRANTKYIGEEIVKKDSLVGKALSLVTWPIRNMSATNRLLDVPFGIARLKSMFTARSAIEFVGTRNNFVTPRSMQNRIEDLSNTAVSTQIELANMFLRANGLEPGLAASEKLILQNKLGKSKFSEDEFFNAVSDELLYVDRPEAASRSADPHIQAAAKYAYDNVYKPFEEILKDYNILDANAGIEQTINYLNRLWSPKKLLTDPEGFKNWLANYYKEANEELKSLMPAYNKELKDVRELKRIANRFEKAADQIDKLKKNVEGKDKFAGDIESLNVETERFRESTTEKYNQQRDAINEKYKNAALKESPDKLKKSLKKEIDASVKEIVSINKSFDKKIANATEEIKDIRKSLKKDKDKIKSGSRDKEIKSDFRKAEVERISENPDLTSEQIELQASDSVDAIDSFALENLRADRIQAEILDASTRIDELKLSRTMLREEKKNLVETQKKGLGKAIKEAKSTNADKNATPKKLELKIIDLKEAKDIAVFEAKNMNRINEIMAPVLKLEALQRQFSRRGFEAYAERRAAEKMAKSPFMASLGEDGIKKMINAARKKERNVLKELPSVDEARVMAKELQEGAQETLLKAEEIIPERLRSSTTGRPYKTWDAADIEYPYNLAEKSFYTMIGQEDEFVINPVLSSLGGGKPSMLKPRSIKMPDNYPGIENWVERDIRTLINNFVNGVSPVIARTEMMQELNKLPIIQQTIRRMQIANPKIGAKKAMEMEPVMTKYTEVPGVIATALREEYRLMSKGLKGDELMKLNKAYKEAEKNLLTQDQQIDGIFGNGININSNNISEFVKIGNSLASTVTNNNIAISMLSGLASNALRYGAKAWYKGLQPYMTDKFVRNISKKQGKELNAAMNIGKGSIIKNRMVGREGSLRNSKFGRFVGNVQNRLGNITGTNALQDFLENTTVCLLQTEMLELSEKAAMGTLTKKRENSFSTTWRQCRKGQRHL